MMGSDFKKRRDDFDRDFKRASRFIGVGFVISILFTLAVTAAIFVAIVIAWRRWS